MRIDLPQSWAAALGPELEKPYWRTLTEFIDAERADHDVYPPPEDVFNAFQLTPINDTRVLLLGQDPYHDVGQAHGLCFSVLCGVKFPPSLRNIFIERRDDLGIPVPAEGSLTPWATQGLMLLNTVMTVRAHEPNSHKGRGWEQFTDAVIRALSERPVPMVFVLWGGYAQKKRALIDSARHVIIESAHPSPLSARSGFFGSRPFSRINDALADFGRPPIDWSLPGDPRQPS